MTRLQEMIEVLEVVASNSFEHSNYCPKAIFEDDACTCGASDDHDFVEEVLAKYRKEAGL